MESILKKINSAHEFSETEIKEAFAALLSEDTSDTDIESFLRALAARPITVEWLTQGALALRAHATSVDLAGLDAIDTAGTGGDQSGSFNFSTAAALLAAACGVPVAKHGNRSLTSRSGSADLLEALGIPIDLPADQVVKQIKELGFAFMMAPRYHKATARVQKIRKALKQVSVFNFLGPLSNPAQVGRQVVGVFDNQVRPQMAEALRRLGLKKAWVVWGEGGLDELTLSGKTFISEVTPEGVRELSTSPEAAVLRQCDLKYLKGGDGAENAKLLKGIFSRSFFGPLVNGVLFNTAAALVVADRVDDLKEGVRMARLALENGDAFALLEKLKQSHE